MAKHTKAADNFQAHAGVWVNASAGSFDQFVEEVSKQTRPEDWPIASAVEQNALVYTSNTVDAAFSNESKRLALKSEWARAFSNGPGLILIRGAIANTRVLDDATEMFTDMIVQQRLSNVSGADHFAKTGSNDRIWNSLEKHCLANPRNYIDYYASNSIALVCEAWLGAGYQISAQVNQVNPGGQRQSAHRDYHLGFMTPEQVSQYPLHVHQFSAMLTLQGAVAHVDMPLESGPTLYLPYSQLHTAGYLAFTRPEYQQYFETHCSQLALEKGDAVFFNPALMHAAGENKSAHIKRLANLLQISSAFGRAMEAIDRQTMIATVYPLLFELKSKNAIDDAFISNVIAATADGYSFPTNLDSDPPVDGLAPQTQAQLAHKALNNAYSAQQFSQALNVQEKRRLSQPDATVQFQP